MKRTWKKHARSKYTALQSLETTRWKSTNVCANEVKNRHLGIVLTKDLPIKKMFLDLSELDDMFRLCSVIFCIVNVPTIAIVIGVENGRPQVFVERVKDWVWKTREVFISS